MPFQIVFSQKAIPAGIIQAISAGEDFATVCDTNVTLEARILGDVQGHTVGWEQISGSPVNFTTPLDGLIISYTQADFDDKTFRFYVDKNTAFEKFDDVNVYGSPVDQIRAEPSQFINMIKVSSGDDINSEAPILKILQPFPMTSHNGSATAQTYNEAVLSWNKPSSRGSLVNFIIKERDNTTGLQNDIAILSPNTYFFETVTIGNSYTVIATFKTPSGVFQKSSNTVWLNGNQSLKIIGDIGASAVDALNISTANANGRSNLYDIDVARLSIKKKDTDYESLDSMPSGHQNRVTITAFDVSSFSLKTFDIPEDDGMALPAPSAKINTEYYFDYDVTVLTGGQVGGS